MSAFTEESVAQLQVPKFRFAIFRRTVLHPTFYSWCDLLNLTNLNYLSYWARVGEDERQSEIVSTKRKR